MTDLKSSIERIRALSPKLNKVTDDASETVQRVEAFLNDECSLGIPAFVNVPELEDEFTASQLGYDRIGARFRIVIEVAQYVRERGPDGELGALGRDQYGELEIERRDTRAWSECSRREKLIALSHLPELLKNIASEAESAIGSAENAIATVNEIVGAIEPCEVRPERPFVTALKAAGPGAPMRLVESIAARITDPNEGKAIGRKDSGRIGPKR